MDKKQKRISAIAEEENDPLFWNDNQKSSVLLKEKATLEKIIFEYKEYKHSIEIIYDFIDLIEEGSRDEENLEKEFSELEKKIKQFEIKVLLNEDYDNSSCYFSLHAGTGGVDAMDFTEMLFRMYLRFFERENFKVDILDKQAGEEAGIKSVFLEVSGEFAYGLLKAEKGVHRLVRKSPFNSKGLRQTSFALIEVIPVIAEDLDFSINPDELRIDTYRSTGAGGQHVNTTDSAVRLTHLPTGIVAQCQNERSQLQNRERAMSILKSRIKLLKIEEQKKKVKDISGETKEASWGHQIRSYVLQPYTLVKDHRTNYEETDVNKVLDGEIRPFIEEFLRKMKNL